MAMIRKLLPAQVKVLADDEVEVRASTATVARDGHILVPQGARLENYKNNPVWLWNHDVDLPPVGRAESIAVEGQEIVAKVKFPPVGISARADEIRGLTKTGFINAVSVGFDPIDGEPLDAAKPRGGMRITDWELVEVSFCCVPVDSEALVTARAEKAEDWKCGASRDLPIEDSDSWDGSAAEASIFEWAGGEDFDPSKARKGFLAYNAAKPKERGSYKLPIAHVVDGRMKVPKGAIRAAASRLSQTDIPSEVKDSAGAVIKHYEEKAGMGEKDSRSIKAKHARALARAPKVVTFKRGLCEVAQLAYYLNQLGYMHECSEYEEAIEGDGSDVPSMLGEALKQLGESFIAMAKEEAEELLSDHADEDDEDMSEDERAYVAAGKTPSVRAWRRGIVLARAGKSLSATNEKKLSDGQDHLDRAMKHHKAIGEHQQAVAGHVDEAKAAQTKADKAHGELGEALQAVKNEPDKATEHVARAVKAHKAVGAAHEDVAEAHENATDRIQDAGDAQQAIGRSIKSAQRCMRSVVEGATPGAEDGDSKDVQTSDGTGDSDGSEGNRSYRKRQADLKALTAALN